MSKFNKQKVRAAVSSPIQTQAAATTLTAEGAPGFLRPAKSELFLLAVTNMVGEDAFYEKASERDARFASLIATVAAEDPHWLVRMLAWVRTEANLRSTALVGALEAAKAMVALGVPGSRAMVASVLQRADEPGEALAYWFSHYGRTIPKPVKRGVADAVARLYTQRALLKYDTRSHAFRFGDVIDLVHPTPDANRPEQGDMFRTALARRHARDEPVPATLGVLAANESLRAQAASDPTVLLDPQRLAAAGMTWEDVLSMAGSVLPKAQLWTAMIPSMGYMALLRNLRNFDEAGVGDDVAGPVAARLADANEVARSRQLPLRFLSAYRAAPSLRWAYALEQALNHSLVSVPTLPGRTLVLVDTSGSMNSTFARDGSLRRWDAAAVFGLALAARSDADVVSFSGSNMVFPTVAGESLLRSLQRWTDGGFFLGGGTETEKAVRTHYRRHDRVVILTDEQAYAHNAGHVAGSVPVDKPVYTFNLAGYRAGHAPSGSGTRHTFGGLTDAGFAMIPLIEAGENANWPF
jgi:hypothetical protein